MSVPRISVLYLPHPEGPRLFDPWGRDVVELVGERHELLIFDRDQSPARQLAAADAVIDHGGASGTRAMADAAGRARLWQILGTGFDHFDLEYWRSRSIPVANCPGALTAVALADAAMMLLLMVARRYPEAWSDLRAGRFYTPAGTELAGLRLCVVGYGASGRELARRARAFGMSVAAIDVVPLPEADCATHGLAFAGAPADLDEQLALADAVSLHLHLDATTRHTIDARRLALMKPSAFIVNVARGELVDEDALVRALSEGALGGAGLDTFAEEPLAAGSPLLRLQNVVVTPHIAGVTRQASRRRAEIAAENVDRVAAGLEPLHRLV
ncbi:MAG: glyoxylate reductase [Gaiellales bacterium]|nr:glyoxylate reductase [Gaiellales bacterium]